MVGTYLVGRLQTREKYDENNKVQGAVVETKTPWPTSEPTLQPTTRAVRDIPVPSVAPERNKVQWTSTEGIVDGTYFCFEDKVNEMTKLENTIKMKEAVADSCGMGFEFDAKDCSKDCSDQNLSMDDYVECSKACWANSPCLPKHEEVGNLRKELMSKIYEYCP